MQEKRRLVKQVDSLELALQIKADEVAELKAKLEAEIQGRLEDQHHHEQVQLKINIYAQFFEYIQYSFLSAVNKFRLTSEEIAARYKQNIVSSYHLHLV